MVLSEIPLFVSPKYVPMWMLTHMGWRVVDGSYDLVVGTDIVTAGYHIMGYGITSVVTLVPIRDPLIRIT